MNRAPAAWTALRLAPLAVLGLALFPGCSSIGTDSRGGTGYRSEAPHRILPRPVAFDVEHYDIELDIDPSTRSVRARCTIRVWPTDTTLERVDLDFEGLVVGGVRDGEGRSLAFETGNGLLSIRLASPLPRGQFAELTVEYAGRPRKGLWFARVRGGVPTQAFTHGECRDAHWWFPCYDEPHERATSELCVTMPAHWKAMAGGDRIDRTVAGDRATERWRMSSPHPAYLETLVAGELAFEDDEWNDLPLAFVAAPEYAQSLRHAFAETDEILALFAELTGARYPYTKYAQCCVDGFPFGGMENASATTLIDTVIPDERGSADASATGIVAHEAAHQWFGDLLTCKDWSQVWLNEGFATYFGALYTERSAGPDAFRREMRGIVDDYLARDVGANRRPIVHGIARDPLALFFTGHIYQGAAARLHHLRSVLGDEAFFAGVKRYVGLNQNGAVETADLERAMSSAAGIDLRWFFEQWFEKPGFPEVSSTWTWDEETRTVALRVEETQSSAGGTPGTFRLPIDVEIASADGARTERILVDRRAQTFELASAARPGWVRLDPHGCVPMLLDERRPRAEWIAIGETCGDAEGRAQAMRVLARSLRETQDAAEKDELARVLLERLQGDASAHVRATAARALLGLATPLVREVLLQVVRDERDRTVRAAVFEALGAFGPDPALAELALIEFERAEGWSLPGALAGLYAKAAPDRAYDWLVARLATPSWHGVWQAYVLAQIAPLHDPRARALFLSIALDPAQPDGARMVAVRELARAGRGDAAVRAALITLLGSDRFRLRREVISALGALHDPGVRVPLERHWCATVFESEKRAIESVLENPAGDA